ncbi:MAG: hypothetical protein Q9160_002288 [Pyrenula sp. 1 TL-2023]
MADTPDEKDLARVETAADDLHEFSEREGYVLEADAVGDAAGLKVAKDGHTILIPQPSDSPKDPLNWSSFKKHLVLMIVSFAAFLPDYGSATGAVTLLPQAEEWHMTPDEVNHSQTGNVFMVGAGGIVVVGLSAYFGRLPPLFWFLVVSLATAAWCAGATSFESFMTARILNGFFSTVAQGGGLMFINDMFFFHERARKINIWAGLVIVSPYFGPLFSAFIITTQRWIWPFWLLTCVTGTALLLTILFVPETYYARRDPALRPSNGNRLLTLIGVHQRRVDLLSPNTPATMIIRPTKVILKPIIFLSCLYYMLTFAWVVGLNTTLSIFVNTLYGFGPKQIGFFYFTPIVGAGLGEIAGHWLHDFVAKSYIRKHNGHFEPEVRLYVTFFSTPFLIAGLVLFGFSLEKEYHYMVLSVSWAMFIFGIMITTVGVTAYCLDSYPEGSGEVAAWINMVRTLGGFIVNYFQVRWALKVGTATSFGTQAAITAFAWLIIPVLLKWGKAMRIRSGGLHFETA